MKKSLLKQKLLQATIESNLNMQMFEVIASELKDTYEALDRRRTLYDRIMNHSTDKEPKSMRQMAESLHKAYTTWALYPSPGLFGGISEYNLTPFQELPEDQQDLWMDRLLTILN